MYKNLNLMFENPFVLITFFGGLLFIVAGFIMSKFPPKSINTLYGYRTSNSMRNQETWDFAQYYSSKEMIKFGFILMISCFLSLIISFDPFINMLIGLSFMILFFIIIVYRVEKAIKIKFGTKS